MKRPRRDHAKEAGVERENTVTNEEDQEDQYYGSSILRLPEACLAHAVSMTSPLDACRSAAVSTAFQAAANSDMVWERFLPPDYSSILARAVDPVDLTSTRKELFLSLTQDHVNLDRSTKSFWLERTSGAKCYMLSSRSLGIIWRENPLHWRRHYSPDSRFEEVAELIAVCWLNVSGSIDSGELSPNTKYAAYLVFNLADESYGLDSPTQEAFITVDDQTVSAKRVVSLHQRTTQETPPCGSSGGTGRRGPEPDEEDGEGGDRAEEIAAVSYPRERDDGWMEVELGEFCNGCQGDTAGTVGIHLIEHVQLNWKKGLILEGIELRQKN